MQFEIGVDFADPARLDGAVELAATLAQRLAQRRAGSVDARAETGEVLAGERAAAEERRVETGALLVHERDDPDRPPRLEALLAQQLDCVHGCDDTEDTVEPAARGHRVQVRPDEDGAAAADLPPPDQVAGGADLDVEADGAHAIADPLVSGEELRRPRHPRDPAVAPASDLRELIEARRDRAGQSGLLASVRDCFH